MSAAWAASPRNWDVPTITRCYLVMFDSAIRGHHIYKEIWNPDVEEELQCKMKHGNIHDMYAVAVTREDIVVGHLPRNICTPCHLFLCKGGNISCVVNGATRFSADLVQVGLEVLFGLPGLHSRKA